jgi:S-adenosylmethionine decarboxylase
VTLEIDRCGPITFGDMSKQHPETVERPTLRAYRKGLHLVVDGEGLAPEPLCDMASFRRVVEERIVALGMESVGAVHHAFPGAGFTSVVCLTESHLSIHTWPEHGRVTFDVFLSNYDRDNAHAVEALAGAIRELMGPGHWTEHRIRR